MVDVVVHLFNQEARMFYDLDSLWGDAKVVEWKAVETAQTV
jgi:ribosomal silencing factor RsfS